MNKVLLRVEEAAAVLSLGRSKMFELIARGAIRAVKIDGATRVPVDEIEAFTQRLKAGSGLVPEV